MERRIDVMQSLEISKLYPHPNNPRQDLGDLSELIESIKLRGILQNLTVVPIDRLANNYYVVIGHRRLEAARQAGLVEIPCVVTEMDHETQVATMLLENMQRENLTVYEQAQGFQTLLDFGESVANIAKKTGFSQNTVRRRTSLLELDSDKFKESAKRNVTLTDYLRLSKIKNIELRNQVLEAAGTANFEYELRKAIDEEERRQWVEKLTRHLDTFATRVEEKKDNHFIFKVFCPGDDCKIEYPTDDAEYSYVVNDYGYIDLYKDADGSEKDDQAEQEKEKRNAAKRGALGEVSERAYDLRHEFACSLPNSKCNIEVIAKYLTLAFEARAYLRLELAEIGRLLALEFSEVENENDKSMDLLFTELKERPNRYMFLLVYSVIETGWDKYYGWDGEHRENKTLDRVYAFLEELGYEMSDEERALQDGTHVLFSVE